MARRQAATNPASSMLLTFTSWLGLRPTPPSTPRPMLIRVGEAGDPQRTVELHTRWKRRDGEVESTRRLYVSDGVCLLAWSREARSVSIEIRSPSGTRRMEVVRETYQGEVLELRD